MNVRIAEYCLVALVYFSPILLNGQVFSTVDKFGRGLPGSKKHAVGLVQKDTINAGLGRDSQIVTKNEKILAFPLAKMNITSLFGTRFHPILRQELFHNGIDLKAGNDTAYAVFSSLVGEVSYNARSGIFIKLKYGEIEAGYAHLSKILVLPGENVEAGQPIGITGGTGMATGNHLHFTIKSNGEYLNPLELLQAARL